jgi:hypothetical protein
MSNPCHVVETLFGSNWPIAGDANVNQWLCGVRSTPVTTICPTWETLKDGRFGGPQNF